MKKIKSLSYLSITILLSGVVFLSSCEQVNLNDNLEQTKIGTKKVSLKGINYNVSLKSAKYLIQSTEGSKPIKNIEPLVFKEDTIMYIFNFEDGWQIVSGDKRTEPIIASDEKGELSTEKLDNPGVAIWLNNKMNQIIQLKKQNPQVKYTKDIEHWVLIDKAAHFTKENLAKYRKKYGAIYSSEADDVQSDDVQSDDVQSDDVQSDDAQANHLSSPGYHWVKRLVSTSSKWKISSQKGPLLQTKWGQETPWNTNMPSAYDKKNKTDVVCPTGCTAVAMAQILYYMHYKIGKPKGLYHSVINEGYITDSKNYHLRFFRGDYNSNSNRWDLMMKKWGSSGNASYVSDLMADVGNRVGMKYAYNGSGADPSNKGFNYYGINCSVDKYNYNTVYSSLQKNNPVLVTAFGTRKTKGTWFWKRRYYRDGHTWVIDGYHKKQETYTTIYDWELVEDDHSSNPFDPYNPYYDVYNNYQGNNYQDNIPDDVFPGKSEVKTSTSGPYTYLIMNWGWSGSEDNGEYNTTTSDKSGWKTSVADFRFEEKIYYNFR